jgi:hypothetical protein
MRLFFLTIPKPPCPLVPYVAGGSNSTRFKKRSSIPLRLKDLEEKSIPLRLKDLEEKLPEGSNK